MPRGFKSIWTEDDLKTMAMKQGLIAVSRLPEMISAVTDGIAKVRNPTAPADPAAARPSTDNRSGPLVE